MQETPRANRLHIGVFGRRNAGKSSLINFITEQETALVSDTPGTTTDPVLKSMELLPLGPVVLIDTAGLDDEGELGTLRVQRTKMMVQRTDLALLVVPAGQQEFSQEAAWLSDLENAGIARLGVLSKADCLSPGEEQLACRELQKRFFIPFVPISALAKSGRAGLLEAIIAEAPTDFERSTIVGDVIKADARVMLVAPQDIQAPKGRLILPQVQVLRDLLDHGAVALISTLDHCERMLRSLSEPPDLVIVDSQVFPQVNALLPRTIPLTSFSILMARYKGDLTTFVRGARAIAGLKEEDSVLIAEACSHHALEGDIARKKLPAMLRKAVGAGLQVDVKSGHTLPEDISRYALILHCGACMFTRKQLMSRIVQAQDAGVPITNYGVAIAAMTGILDRVVEIF